MKPLHDYFYRFPHTQFGMPGRCRVRIYQRPHGGHTVVLTELDTYSAESIASACERIATDIAAVRRLNPKTTRWVHHDPSDDDRPAEIGELEFTWDGSNTASDPQWQRLTGAQAEALTGDSLSALNRRLGDTDMPIDEGSARERTEA